MNFLRRLMYGRYGTDQLNIFLLVLYLVFYLLSVVTGLTILAAMGIVAFLFSVFRMMSRKIDRRRGENAKFMSLFRPVVQWVKLRRSIRKDKEHCYFKCPHCGQHLRVPKGKGKITVTCRSCGTSFQEKS